MVILTLSEAVQVSIGGAIGALAKDVLQDNCIELPHLERRRLFLGSIGCAIVGAFLGYVVDGNGVTAALAGYTGKSILGHLLSPDNIIPSKKS